MDITFIEMTMNASISTVTQTFGADIIEMKSVNKKTH